MTLSFEGADGYGEYATGGRGGSIVKVNNSNNSGLRDWSIMADAEQNEALEQAWVALATRNKDIHATPLFWQRW